MIWKFYIEDFSYVQTEIENPVGWADAVFKFKRDKELHGVFFEYSIPLKFHGNGYDIIKAAYDAEGVEAYLRVVVDVQCIDGEDFENFYTGKLNFTKINFLESDVCFVECVIEDDSCLSMFNNRQDQEVELESLVSLDGETMVPYEWINKNLSLPPKAILKTDGMSYLSDEETAAVASGTDTHTSDGLVAFFLYFWLEQPDMVNELGGMLDDYESGFVAGSATTVEDFWTNLFIPNADATISVTGLYHVNLTIQCVLTNVTLDGGAPGETFKDVGANVILRVTHEDLTTTDTTLFITAWTGYHDNTFSEDISFDLGAAIGDITTNVALGDKYAVYLEVEVISDYTVINPIDPVSILISPTVTDFTDSFIKFQVITNFPATDASVSMVNESLARIVESITNKCLTVKSDYFGREDSEPYVSVSDGCGALEVITNGLLIRRNDDATHKISFKKLYDGLSAIHNLGMGIEEDTDRAGYDRIRIEQASYFYSDDVILTCDKVPDIRRTVITDEHFSLLEFGYTKWEAEEFNGLDEFNTSRKYRTSLKNIRNTISKLCGLIASGYAIEITRQQFSKTSFDWRYDNDDFIICVKREYSTIIVEQGNIDTPSNIIDPDTVYNFRISPIRNLLRWLNKVLASYVDPANGGSVFFTSGTGNTLAEGLNDSGCVVEADVISEQEPEIDLNTLASPDEGLPIYKLESWEFEYPLSFEDYNTLKANPKGVIKVRYGQQTDYVDTYLREIEYKPNQGIAIFIVLPRVGETICIGGIGCMIIEDTFIVG